MGVTVTYSFPSFISEANRGLLRDSFDYPDRYRGYAENAFEELSSGSLSSEAQDRQYQELGKYSDNDWNNPYARVFREFNGYGPRMHRLDYIDALTEEQQADVYTEMGKFIYRYRTLDPELFGEIAERVIGRLADGSAYPDFVADFGLDRFESEFALMLGEVDALRAEYGSGDKPGLDATSRQELGARAVAVLSHQKDRFGATRPELEANGSLLIKSSFQLLDLVKSPKEKAQFEREIESKLKEQKARRAIYA